MATKRLSCTACAWSDERDAATRVPVTCPECGHDVIAVNGETPVVDEPKKKPAPRRRR